MKNLKNYFLTILCLFSLQTAFSVDYYWVGGSGNWSNISNWATTSGGNITHSVVPSADDNVIFDANSFTGPNQTVTINIDNIFCRNMDWSAVTNNPTFIGTRQQIINVFGSLTFSPNMTLNFDGEFQFRTDLADATVTTANQPMGWATIFDGNGTWQFN
ncbi:MAG: hypothetical protein AAFO07_20025, partial [Bacteroidota bacterium]